MVSLVGGDVVGGLVVVDAGAGGGRGRDHPGALGAGTLSDKDHGRAPSTCSKSVGAAYMGILMHPWEAG